MKKEESEGRRVRWDKPLKKHWGVQTDGDLWEMAWKAICTRGVENQAIRKVKGHATTKDVQDGVATKEDKIGNDTSDTNADIGVAKINGARPGKAG